MKVIEIRQTFYQCEICKTNYKTRRGAEKCERRTLEKNPFKVGDQVQNVEPRQCDTTDKIYFFKGRIVKIIGPVPADKEYETKWLGGDRERLNSHVFEYRVNFSCPHCKSKNAEQSAQYYAPELKLI